jgi:restriction system protein
MVRVWLLRPIPHFNNQMKYFLEQNRIAVGYPVSQPLGQYSYEQIRQVLKSKGMESGIGNVDKLVHQMKIGDLVVVPDENARDVYFAKITGNYKHEPTLDDPDESKGLGFPHQREVKWYFDKKSLQRSELPEALLKSLRFPGAVAELTKHLPLVAELVGEEELIGEGREADPTLDRLYEKALQVLEDALDGQDVNSAVRAADIILHHTKE